MADSDGVVVVGFVAYCCMPINEIAVVVDKDADIIV